MKRRLVTFGCSFTYGQGLPDCPTGVEAPSQYSWPYLLSSQLDRQLVNRGIPGASNLQILNEILNFEFEETDLNGQTKSMSEFKNKVLLIVNTASQCGFTNQYKDLEDLQ
jgi:hypothetical protein